MAIELRWIEWGSDDYEKMLSLRDQVLRRPLGMTLDRSNLELERDFGLLCAFHGVECVGTMVMTHESDTVARMRAVAVSPSQQGSGIGRRMVEEFERRSLELGLTEVVLHARDVAIDFYLRQGYETFGDEFIEVTIPHRKMRKRLAQDERRNVQ